MMTVYRTFGGVLFERPSSGVFWTQSDDVRRAAATGARIAAPPASVRCECSSRTFRIIHTDHYEVSGECARCGRRDVVASG